MAFTTSPRLSPLQQQVVDFDEGAVLVIAGPGSGKTRVLTERVRRLLTKTPGHFRVLALTFTNKAASEMKERLKDLGDLKRRAFIGTFHGFALDVLRDRGAVIGVPSDPQMFEHYQDRRRVLFEAVQQDPGLLAELNNFPDEKERSQALDRWLKAISWAKAHPLTYKASEPLLEQVIEAYNAGLRASGAYDFDDLLLLCYQLLSSEPKIADFYRRLYRFICVDEAQDLNEAQLAILTALCGSDFSNVMLVGDPNQSIYGFNTSSPTYMFDFAKQFSARAFQLTDNFRSSRAVIEIAQALEPTYQVAGQMPVPGRATLIAAADEQDEARRVADELQRLFKEGHPDVEGAITPSRCGILGRTRYVLLNVEKELKSRGVPFFKRLSANHEHASELIKQFQLALRVVANPRDKLHLVELLKSWGHSWTEAQSFTDATQVIAFAEGVAKQSTDAGCQAIVEALKSLTRAPEKVDLVSAIAPLRKHADSQSEDSKRAIYEDTEVLIKEWDQYLRTANSSVRSIGGYLSAMALGTTQQINSEGVALLTVHSSKGLEFEVIFVVGMADGVFPDYRAKNNVRESAEEARNIFVAVTRSRRLLYFSYPMLRTMPWGAQRITAASPYVEQVQHLLSERLN